MNIMAAQKRSELYTNIRKFFLDRGYLETETPVLSSDLIPEPTIDCFETTFINEFLGSKSLFMIPSPEIFMKKVISETKHSVFEITKCFRNCEQVGEIHNPEFTMLEYYTVGFDEKDSIELTKKLLKDCAISNCCPDVSKPWIEMTVQQAVLKYTGLDLDKLQNPKDLRNAAEGLGLLIPGPESWDDTFNRIFCNFVETSIPQDCPVLFTDYPKQINCLAIQKGNYRRRWELYLNGIEVANCYFEESDPEKVKDYYQEEFAKMVEIRNENGRPLPDIDINYSDVFNGFPKCSGVAIGLDRLLMAMMGTDRIEDVLLFQLS